MTLLNWIKRAGTALERSCHPFFRIIGLFWLANNISHVDREVSHVQRIQDHEPRALLLAGVETMARIPFCLLWMALVSSFTRDPGVRWMIAGGLLGLVPSVIFAVRHPLYPNRAFEVAITMSHLGFWLGQVLSLTPLACWLDPALSQYRDGSSGMQAPADPTIDTNAQISGEDVPLNEKTSTTKAPTNHPRIPEITIVYVYTMLWLTALLCPTIVGLVQEYTNPPDGFWLLQTICAFIFFPVTYGFIALCFFRNTRHVTWECVSGVILGSGSLVLLRCTALDSTWQSWLIDVGLALVGLNVGMAGGLHLRYQSMKRDGSPQRSVV